MAYRVKITPRAERDLIEIYAWIGAESSDSALAWYNGLREAISTLRYFPNRCPTTPENRRLKHLLYGHKPNLYRVIYRVVESEKGVEVVHIRQGARDEFR